MIYDACGLMVLPGDTDLAEINAALDQALSSHGKPTLIKVRTTIGYGSLLQGTAACHGNPLKKVDLEQFKQKRGIAKQPFSISDEYVPAS